MGQRRAGQWLRGGLSLQVEDEGKELLVADCDPAVLRRVVLAERRRQRLQRNTKRTLTDTSED